MKDFFQKVWRVLILVLLLQCTIKVVHYYTRIINIKVDTI